MTSRGLSRMLVAIALPWLLLAACDSSSGGGATPAPGQTSAPDRSPPAALLPAASDNGSVEVREVGFTAIGPPPVYVIWAVVLENTSQTDLLASVYLDLTWRDEDKVAERVDYWAGGQVPLAYDILPGATAVVGGQATIWDRDITPGSVDVSVRSEEWYPMWGLEARDAPVGVEVTDFSIVDDLAVQVRVTYTSSYQSPLDGSYSLGDEDLRLLVVMRDASGMLLGALPGADFNAAVPGEYEQQASVRHSQWPDEADPGTSEVAVTRVCCHSVLG